jgi:hypothetical protein
MSGPFAWTGADRTGVHINNPLVLASVTRPGTTIVNLVRLRMQDILGENEIEAFFPTEEAAHAFREGVIGIIRTAIEENR